MYLLRALVALNTATSTTCFILPLKLGSGNYFWFQTLEASERCGGFVSRRISLAEERLERFT